ncbi:transcriptional regulator, AraC family domain protein [Burkholderia pseudomallei MSHR640]|nr:transcriptional regulator, AraC family domain protein [Burkholderia pseudomallei MSHR640]
MLDRQVRRVEIELQRDQRGHRDFDQHVAHVAGQVAVVDHERRVVAAQRRPDLAEGRRQLKIAQADRHGVAERRAAHQRETPDAIGGRVIAPADLDAERKVRLQQPHQIANDAQFLRGGDGGVRLVEQIGADTAAAQALSDGEPLLDAHVDKHARRRDRPDEIPVGELGGQDGLKCSECAQYAIAQCNAQCDLSRTPDYGHPPPASRGREAGRPAAASASRPPSRSRRRGAGRAPPMPRANDKQETT